MTVEPGCYFVPSEIDRALADPAMVFPAPFSPLGPPHYGRRPRARCPGAQRGGPERKRGDALL